MELSRYSVRILQGSSLTTPIDNLSTSEEDMKEEYSNEMEQLKRVAAKGLDMNKEKQVHYVSSFMDSDLVIENGKSCWIS